MTEEEAASLALEDISHLIPEPIKCGVYFLYLRGDLLYIGQSNNVAKRLYAHTMDYDRVLFFPVAQHWLLAVEATLIRKFAPPLNFSMPSRQRKPRLMVMQASKVMDEVEKTIFG